MGDTGGGGRMSRFIGCAALSSEPPAGGGLSLKDGK
jgi:hypothetical protein